MIRSIKKFGMVLPVLIDKHDTIVAGHVLWDPAIELGFETIECRVVEHLGPVELEALSNPPNNCPIAGFVGGLGKHQYEDFLMFSGKEGDDEFRQFLGTCLRLCRASSAPGTVIFACIDWRQIDILLEVGRDAGLDRINVAVWDKGSAAWEACTGLSMKVVRITPASIVPAKPSQSPLK